MKEIVNIIQQILWLTEYFQNAKNTFRYFSRISNGRIYYSLRLKDCKAIHIVP